MVIFCERSQFVLLLLLILANASKGQADPPRLDENGDPLPAGAIARLGTIRLRHGSPVWGLAFTPDGKALASAGDDGLRLWQVPSGKEIWRHEYEARHARGALVVACSPDGRLLATGSDEFGVQFWETATGHLHRNASTEERTYTVAFAPDGKTLASGGREGTVLFEDVATGTRMASLRVPGRLACVVFAPNGRLFATATTGDKVQVWDSATRTELPQFRDRQVRGLRVTLSPDSSLLAAASGGGCSLWEVSSGKELRRLDKGSGDVVFSPAGRTLATTDGDAVRLWETATGKVLAVLPWDQMSPHRLCVSPDGKYLAASGRGPAITVWDLTTLKEVSPVPARRQPVCAVALSPDQKFLAVGSSDNYEQAFVSLWNVKTSREVHRLRQPRFSVPAVLFAEGGRSVIAGPTAHGAIRRWQTDSGEELPFIDGEERTATHRLAISPEGKTLAVSDTKGVVRLYDVATRQELCQVKTGAGEGGPLALGPGGSLLAVSDGNGGVRLVDTARSALRRVCPQDSLRALAFSADGQLLATGGSGPIRLWEVATGKERPSLSSDGQRQIAVLAFAQDGRTLAAVDTLGTIRVWELATRGLRQLFRAAAPVTSLSYSGDSRVLVSGSYDTTILLWDLTATAGPGDWQTCWVDLAEGDSATAHRALWQFARGPEQALLFLKDHLRPALPLDRKHMHQCVADLDNSRFEVREKATRTLEEFGEAAEQALVEMLRRQPALESRRRAQQLLDKIKDNRPPPGQRRQLRAVEALEHMGTAGAWQMLQELAGGASDAPLTRAAREALARRVP
jgi:WD40 repeat protein